MDGIALAPQARATEGGQMCFLPPCQAMQFVNFMPPICIAYISCDDGVNVTWFERHYIIV